MYNNLNLECPTKYKDEFLETIMWHTQPQNSKIYADSFVESVSVLNDTTRIVVKTKNQHPNEDAFRQELVEVSESENHYFSLLK